MAQIRVNSEFIETQGLVTSDGQLVTAENPLPVTLGSDSITITGSVNVGTTVEITNDEGNSIPTHTHIFLESDDEVSEANPFPVSIVNINAAQAASKNFYLAVAQGEVPGYTFVHIAGYNPDLDQTNPITTETIWSGNTVYPWEAWTDGGSAQTIYFLSTSASDVGCQFLVQGLDADWEPQEETITLNGLTAVTGTKTWRRINNMTIANSQINVGTVTGRVTSGTGTIIDIVNPGNGYNATGIYTIPAGYTGYLMVGDASVSKSADLTITMWSRQYGKSFRVAHIASIFESFYRYDFTIPIPLLEKTDIDVRGQSFTENTRASCNFDILLVANP